jgi:hypothetical protein
VRNETRVRVILLPLLFCSWILAVTPCRADGEPAAPVEASLASAVSSNERDREGMALFDRAQEKYMEGDLVEALRLLEHSYELSRRPALLFNLGQLNQELDRCRAALERYQRYLELEPHGGRCAEAESAIARLNARCPAPPPPVATASAPAAESATATLVESEPRTASYWTARNTIAWSAITTGMIAEAGALYFAIAARNAAQDVESAAAKIEMLPPNMRPTWDATGRNRQAEGERAQSWGIGLGLGGAALLAGGIVALATAPDRHASHSTVSFLLPRRGVGVSYSIAF